MGQLINDFNKSQKYLKLADGEIFEGTYIAWKKVQNTYGGSSWQFTLERNDDASSRVEWTTANAGAVKQMDDLLEGGLKKGSPIKIACKVIGQTQDGKNKYEYEITSIPF